MEHADVLERTAPTPRPLPSAGAVRLEQGEAEWMRYLVGRDTKVRLLVSGEMGPKEIGRLIKLLQAQKTVLDEDADDEIS